MGFFHLEEKGHKPGYKTLDFFRCVINSNVITLTFTILKNSTASETFFGLISKTLYFTQTF